MDQRSDNLNIVDTCALKKNKPSKNKAYNEIIEI